MNLSWKRYFPLLIATCLSVFLLSACGDKKEDDKSALNKAPGLKKRLAQLDNTLDQLERETQIQQQRIKAAKNEVDLLREMFTRGRQSQFMFDEASTATVISLTPMGMPESSQKAPSEGDRESARDRFFETLVILLFGLFAGVYLIKLYRDRANAPSNRQDQPLSKEYDTTSRPLDSDAPSGGLDRDAR